MKTEVKIRSIRLVLTLGFWLCVCPTVARAANTGGAATGQNAAGLPTRNFSAALMELAIRRHIAIVAEGVPLRASLPEAIVAASSSPNGSVDEEVQALGAAFDYDCQRAGLVFALSKRYTQPDDLPSVTMGEWVWVLREIKRLTDPLNPRTRSRVRHRGDRDPVVGDLAVSFTDGQLAALHGNGVPLRAMTPAQVALVRRFALNLYVEAAVKRVDFALDCLADAGRDVVFHYEDIYAAKHVFGYDDRGGAAGAPWFEPLSGPYAGLPNFAGRMIFNQLPDAARDPTVPGDSALDLPYPVGFTLGGLAERLTAAGNGRVRVEVDPLLRTKAITVAGSENAAPQAVMAAAASVYGLDLQTSMEGGKRLIHLGFPADPLVPPYAAGLHDALSHVIPRPLVRAFHVEEVINTLVPLHRVPYRSYGLGPPPDPAPVTARPPWEDETFPELRLAIQDQVNTTRYSEMFHHFVDLSRQSDAVPRALKVLAVRRLRALIEPRLKATPGERLRYASLNEQERDVFATVVVSDCFSGLSSLCLPAPRYISDFDHVTLTGGLSPNSDGTQTIGLFFTFPRPDGRMDSGGDGIGTRYVK